MKRILIGLIVAAMLAAGGWFGFNLYAKHRATAEVEAAFEQMRAGGGKASHGKVEFDLMSRTLIIEDIAVTPGSQPQAQVRIAGIKGTGVRQIDDGRFSADSIDITGIDVALDQVGQAKVKASYKIPQLTMRDYAGPLHTGTAPANGSLIDLYRYVLGQYASVTATSLTAPTLTTRPSLTPMAVLRTPSTGSSSTTLVTTRSSADSRSARGEASSPSRSVLPHPPSNSSPYGVSSCSTSIHRQVSPSRTRSPVVGP